MNRHPGDKAGDRSLPLEKLRLVLRNRPRDLLFFEIAVQTSATIPQILALRVPDLKCLAEGAPLPLATRIPARLDTRVKRALSDLMAEVQPEENGYLFLSRKGRLPLSHTSTSRMVRRWIEEAGLESVDGLRGLRKLYQRQASGDAVSGTSPVVPQLGQVLPRVESLTRQEMVYQELEKAIISGQIPPGRKLVTDEIARQMGVSRIPVREAMGRLEARGFIVTWANWGSVVKELTRKNLKEILDLRLLLECEAIAKAAPIASRETVAALVDLHKAFTVARNCNDAERLLRANREFHQTAYRDADSPILLELIDQLWNRVSPYYHIMFRQSVTVHPRSGLLCHEKILLAMQRRNAEQARHWLKTDLIGSAEYVLKLFDLYQIKK